MKKGKAGCGLILDHKDRTLLQRKDSGSWYWPNYWCLFGGVVEEGEDPSKTFEREIREEIGINLLCYKLFSIEGVEEISKQDPTKEIRRFTEVYYFAGKFDGNLENVRLGEGAGFSVFDREELARYNQFGLIVPPNYMAIERFYKAFGEGTFKL